MSFGARVTIFFWLIFMPLAYGEEKLVPVPEICKTDCITNFGEELGKTADGVVAYSNCKAHCFYPSPSERDGNFLGIKWQCVEFARRWLYSELGLTFASIDTASDFWQKVDHLTHVKEKRDIPLEAYVNGSAVYPARGDLLIYGKDLENTGHIAVVLGIDRKKQKIFVGEDNFLNKKWPGTYARAVSYVREKGKTWLLDSYFIGWKHIKNPKP